MVAQIKNEQNCVQKYTNVSSIGKNNRDFFQKFPMISLAKQRKNENSKIRHYPFKMTDNDLKIWHMVDAKFGLVLRPISHGNPAMPFNILLNVQLLVFANSFAESRRPDSLLRKFLCF